MSLLDDFPAAWRTDVTVTGPVHRTQLEIGRASCRERV